MAVAVPPGVLTSTETVPTPWAGAVTVTVVAVLLVMGAFVPPKVTEVAPVRLVPVMTTEVPPAMGPASGLRVLIVGRAA